jgi:hypothetical protein
MTGGFQLPCHFRKVFRSNSANQPDGRAAPADSLFDPQGHIEAFKRNEWAIRKHCKDGKLQTGVMLIFQQMPIRQQKLEVSNRKPDL